MLMKIKTNKMKYKSGLDHISSLLVITSLFTGSYGKNIFIDDMIKISISNVEKRSYVRNNLHHFHFVDIQLLC